MSRSAELQAYIDRNEAARVERHARARAEGCPAGWEEEWRTSSKFRMSVLDRAKRS